ncbi:MAG: hypothetical protein ACRBDL_06555 [Alphaproteobacteria bacterium]
MFRLKNKKPKNLLLAGGLVAIGLGVSLYMAGGFPGLFSGESDISVTLKEFEYDASVAYELYADGQVVEEGHNTLPKGEALRIPLSDEIAQKAGVLNYKMRVTPSAQDLKDTVEPLEFLVDVDTKTNDINVSGRGLEDFSDISLKTQQMQDMISADWAGMFSAQGLNKSTIEGQGAVSSPFIELAFQNAGIGADYDQLGGGKMEVFFGDGSAMDINDVQDRYTLSLIMMTEELSAVMVMQTQIIGMFFDARIQLQTQRKHQELMARAHKDYHPSEQICRIGTFMRSVAQTESKAKINKKVLNKVLMSRYLGVLGSGAASGATVEQRSENYDYQFEYCHPSSNNGAADGLCDIASQAPASLTPAFFDRMNQDVDYARTLAIPLTLDVDFSDRATGATANNDITNDEEAVVALAKHLYMPNVFSTVTEDKVIKDPRIHYNSRSFAAKMNVAHSSFLHIVGMKSSAPEGNTTTTTATSPAPTPELGPASVSNRRDRPFAYDLDGNGTIDAGEYVERPVRPLDEDSGWAYMKALFREFGMTDDDGDGNLTNEIDDILGVRPSYYAQMEVLTKKIYQSPDFYTNLYDKPANVERIGASIDAITLMNQRDRFESMLRREMLTSLLLEEELTKHTEGVNARVYELMRRSQFTDE